MNAFDVLWRLAVGAFVGIFVARRLVSLPESVVEFGPFERNDP